MAKNAQNRPETGIQNPDGYSSATVANYPASAPMPLPLIDVAKRQGIIRRPDGSFLLELVVEAEEAMLLESWAETADEPLEGYIQTMMTEALKAFCSQQAG